MKRTCLLFLALALFACDELIEKDLSGKTLEIISPIDHATALAGDVTFLWREMDGARGYHVTIVAPSFISAGSVVADTILVAGNRKYTCTLGEGRYEWSIRAVNSAYSTKEQVFALDILKEPEQ